MSDKTIILRDTFFRNRSSFLTALAMLGGLAVLSRHNYLLFHGLAELATVAVGWSLFLLVWSSRRMDIDSGLLFLGIAYFFVGFIDLFHTLAFKGMGIFPQSQGANPATQLWVSARLVEAFSLMLLPFVLGRKRIPPGFILTGYALVSLLLLASILIRPVFPDCYTAGHGLTGFKKGAEIFISLVLAVAMVLLYRKRARLDPDVFRLMMAALMVTIVSELVLMNYADVYDITNMTGHLLKVLSFYLIFLAMTRAVVTRPYETIFQELNREKLALMRSEELYRLIVENTTEDIWQLDLDGRVIFVSQAVERLFGYTVEEALQLDFASFFPDKEQPAARQAFMKALSGADRQLFEFSARRKDGSTLPIEVSVTPIRREGAIIGVQGIARDITDRRIAEELSRINYQKYRLVYDQSPIAIELYDQAGKLLDVNPACLELFGVANAADLSGFDLFKDPNLPHDCRQRLKTGRTVGYQALFDFEKIRDLNLYRTDRRGTIWVDVTITPLGGEMPIGYLVQAQDITDYKKALEALRKSEEKFRGYLENAPYGVFIADRFGRYVEANPAATRITGYSRSELLHMGISDLLAPESREKGWANFNHLAHHGHSEGETNFLHKSGEVRSWNVCAVRLSEDRFLGFVEDITDRRLAADRLQESEERYRLLAENVSDVIWTMDLDLRFTYVSPSIRNLRGYTPAEALIQPLSDVLAPASYQQALSLLAGEWDKVLEGGFEPLDFECEFTRQDGTTVWGESVISVVYGADGSPRSILGITRDITQRRQLDENREQLLRLMAEEMNIQQAIVAEAKNVLEIREFPVVARRIFDAARELTGARSGYVALLSDSGEENQVLFLESGGLECTVDPSLPMPIRGLRAEAYKTGDVAIDNDFAGSPWMSFMPAGHAALKNVLFAPLNIGGKTLGLIGLANKPDDFTEKDRVIARSFGQLAAMALNNSRNLALLEESEARLRETARISRTGGWELNAQTLDVHWTEETYHLHEIPLGHKPPLKEAINFFYPEDRRRLSDAIDNALNYGTPYDLELRFITARGRHLWTRTICQPVVQEGKTVQLKGTFQDITERKQFQEKILKTLKEKETLLSEVHHRVKNNLQIISSLINLQINELEHAETIAHLKETRSRIQAMAFIHEDLYASPSMSELDMALHINKIARGVSQSYDGVSTGIGVTVTADNIYLSLTQALPVGLTANELLTNVYKHAFPDRKKDGKIQINLQQLPGNLIRMIISDNGVGIPASVDWKNGSSFGLRLAVSLVENQLEGRIELERGPGTTFTITFTKDA